MKPFKKLFPHSNVNVWLTDDLWNDCVNWRAKIHEVDPDNCGNEDDDDET